MSCKDGSRVPENVPLYIPLPTCFMESMTAPGLGGGEGSGPEFEAREELVGRWGRDARVLPDGLEPVVIGDTDRAAAGGVGTALTGVALSEGRGEGVGLEFVEPPGRDGAVMMGF